MADGGGEVAAAVPPSGAANGLSNGAGGILAQTGNPLSRKLNKILETRLDNDKVTGAGGAGSRVAGRAASARRRLPHAPVPLWCGGGRTPAGAGAGRARAGRPTRPWKSEEVP